MKTLIKNIRSIIGITEPGTLRKCGKAMSEVGTLDDAWVLIDDERIEDFGSMTCCPESEGATVNSSIKSKDFLMLKSLPMVVESLIPPIFCTTLLRTNSILRLWPG